MEKNKYTNRIKELEAELAKATSEKALLSSIYFDVSKKGGVSVYGLQRFPVTLYANQWEKLLAKADDLKAFIEKNKRRLSVKKGPTNQ